MWHPGQVPAERSWLCRHFWAHRRAVHSAETTKYASACWQQCSAQCALHLESWGNVTAAMFKTAGSDILRAHRSSRPTPSHEEQTRRSLEDEKLSEETPSDGGLSRDLPRAAADAIISKTVLAVPTSHRPSCDMALIFNVRTTT